MAENSYSGNELTISYIEDMIIQLTGQKMLPEAPSITWGKATCPRWFCNMLRERGNRVSQASRGSERQDASCSSMGLTEGL